MMLEIYGGMEARRTQFSRRGNYRLTTFGPSGAPRRISCRLRASSTDKASWSRSSSPPSRPKT